VADTQHAMPEMKLELVPVPVADVDRARAFYEQAGFKLEVDSQMSDTMRVVQFTPPGSACTIVFGTGMPGISDMQPGSVHGLHLVVDDIDEARQALLGCGVQVDEVIDVNQVKYAGFRDPDGNTWLLQAFPPELRQPARASIGRSGRPRSSSAASGFAAPAVAVAVQVELVGTDHADRAFHVVGTVAGAAGTVVVADAKFEAFALVGGMAVP
jgi:catechol 2,3-dioxygenase-like lactoylglutathione lyase family enzyme